MPYTVYYAKYRWKSVDIAQRHAVLGSCGIIHSTAALNSRTANVPGSAQQSQFNCTPINAHCKHRIFSTMHTIRHMFMSAYLQSRKRCWFFIRALDQLFANTRFNAHLPCNRAKRYILFSKLALLWSMECSGTFLFLHAIRSKVCIILKRNPCKSSK